MNMDDFGSGTPSNEDTNMTIEACDDGDAPLKTSKRDKEAKDSNMWATSGKDYFPCDHAVSQLAAGQYVVRESHSRGIYFSKSEINLDNLIELPDNNSEKVIAGIKNFWEREQFFREFGFLWKRGVMLYGPPGSGKTSTVQQLAKLIVDMDGISVYCTHPSRDAAGLRLLRNIEPDRPIVVILEDIDAIIQSYGESDLLAMLDGELQVDNVVFVATTNYPEKLDKRFVNRPSRFDEVTYIGMPSLECRKTFLSVKNPSLNAEELDMWADKTEGMSIAHLRELIVSVECLGNDFNETVERLSKMMKTTLSSDRNEDTADFGFAQKVNK